MNENIVGSLIESNKQLDSNSLLGEFRVHIPNKFLSNSPYPEGSHTQVAIFPIEEVTSENFSEKVFVMIWNAMAAIIDEFNIVRGNYESK